MTEERFLISGGTGCIGSWVVRGLVREGAPVTVVTTGRRRDRLELILTPVELAAVEILEADVNDLETIEAAARRAGVTAVVHLAALQLPFCAADPVGGARVNVQGTAFELARRLDIGRLVYASSAAVYGPKDHYADEVVGPDAELFPTSHYACSRSPTSRQRASTGRPAASRASGSAPTAPTARAVTRASRRSPRSR